MPPQAYATPAAPAAVGANSQQAPSETRERSQAAGDETRERRRHREEHSTTGRTSRRILGDYTLSKTLGAGSMGKVKLATHNVTGEKACHPFFSVSSRMNLTFEITLFRLFSTAGRENSASSTPQPTASDKRV